MPTPPATMRAGVIQVIMVALTTVNDVASTPPMVTEVAPIKSLPLRVTSAPPFVLPVNGEIPLIEGGVTKVKESNVLLGPPPVLTITPEAPDLLRGVLQVSVVSLTTVILVEAALPNRTDVAPVRFVPVIVTIFPPRVLPAGGEISLITGGVIYMNDKNVLLGPPPVLTITSTGPAVRVTGVLQVIVVSLTALTVVALNPPNRTEVAPLKLIPVIVTTFPPVVPPKGGEMLVMTGGKIYVKGEDFLVGPPPVVTIMPTGPGAIRAGVIQVNVLLSITVNVEQLKSPTVTSVAPIKSVPIIVTVFPPVVLPKFGEMLVSLGVII